VCPSTLLRTMSLSNGDGLKRPTGLSLCGHGKKRHLHAHRIVSFMYNPRAPFGLELMAERKHWGHLLSSIIIAIVHCL